MPAVNILQVVFNGLGLSASYALFAVGMTLVFGTMKIINFAHGELYMLGTFIVWVVLSIGRNYFPIIPLFFIGLILGMLAVGGLGVAIERAVFRPLRARPFAVFMSSIGLLYILQVSAGQIFGVKGKMAPVVFPSELRFAGATLSVYMAVTIFVAVIVLGLLWFFLERTVVGRAVRATAQDSEAAALHGISSKRMSAIVMGLGAALAAAAGALVGTSFLIGPFMGWTVLWKANIVTIVGGMGSIGGAIVASLVFGFLDSTVISLGDPELVVMINVLIMLLILAIRPQGLLGRER